MVGQERMNEEEQRKKKKDQIHFIQVKKEANYSLYSCSKKSKVAGKENVGRIADVHTKSRSFGVNLMDPFLPYGSSEGNTIRQTKSRQVSLLCFLVVFLSLPLLLVH